MFPNFSSTPNILFAAPSPSCHYLYKELTEDTKWTKTGTLIAVPERRGDVQAGLCQVAMKSLKRHATRRAGDSLAAAAMNEKSLQHITRHGSSGLGVEAGELLTNAPQHAKTISELLSSFFPVTWAGLFITNGVIYIFVWMRSHLVFLFMPLLWKGWRVHRTCSAIFRTLVREHQ